MASRAAHLGPNTLLHLVIFQQPGAARVVADQLAVKRVGVEQGGIIEQDVINADDVVLPQREVVDRPTDTVVIRPLSALGRTFACSAAF